MCMKPRSGSNSRRWTNGSPRASPVNTWSCACAMPTVSSPRRCSGACWPSPVSTKGALRSLFRVVRSAYLLLRTGLEGLPAHTGPVDRPAATTARVRPVASPGAAQDARALRQPDAARRGRHLAGGGICFPVTHQDRGALNP